MNKEQTVSPIADAAPVLAETEAALGQAAPDDLKAEVQAAIALAVEAGESSKNTVEGTLLSSPTEDRSPDRPQA